MESKLQLIGISKENKQTLDKLKMYKRETYDDVLKKLLKNEMEESD